MKILTSLVCLAVLSVPTFAAADDAAIDAPALTCESVLAIDTGNVSYQEVTDALNAAADLGCSPVEILSAFSNGTRTTQAAVDYECERAGREAQRYLGRDTNTLTPEERFYLTYIDAVSRALQCSG